MNVDSINVSLQYQNDIIRTENIHQKVYINELEQSVIELKKNIDKYKNTICELENTICELENTISDMKKPQSKQENSLLNYIYNLVY